MRDRALRMFRGAARRAHGRTYPRRAVGVAGTWQYPDGPQRLVPAPVFLLGSMRSGATVLSRMLDTHSRMCVPHEMHMGSWRVETRSTIGRRALQSMGMSADDLANLLWDRVLHLHLINARKSIVIDKTPRNTLQWQRIASVWPQARFLILVRHPVRVAESLVAAHPQIPAAEHYAGLERYAVALHDAQHGTKNALTVRYEDLVADPTTATRRIAEWLGVPWEQAMVDRAVGGALSVQPVPDPCAVPDGLRKSCELLGYL